MADIVNLRTARKRKHRARNEVRASENRALHGRSGQEQAGTALTRRLGEARLAGHRRETGTPDPDETSK